MNDEIQNVMCPLCETPGFSASGLSAHRCNGGNRKTGSPARFEKRKLTSEEYVAAVLAAKKAQANQLMRGGGQ